ncbi:cytochrome P450 Cyp6b29 [Bombyx mori]|uniref:unspecific monooxygenase n=1 Tax=Bombyx mori TaxID=7091 RepID=Q2XTF2_BOMMO|nr:cytochrome P450 Cyp6b29 [Bombyx mori]ABB58822.1 cytochrome P450 Cyp6b29 [Bombyx mori]
MAIIYILLASVVLPLLLYLYFTRHFNYWKKRNVPGPKPVPLFGNLMESALRKKNIGIVFKELYENFPNEKVVGIYRMTTPCLLIRDQDVIKNIMIKDFDVFVDRGVELSKSGLGANLFHADGDTWRVLRNRFTPLFTSGKLKNMLHLMIERANKYIEHVEMLCDHQPEQDIHTLVQKYTMATIAACAFGLDIDTTDPNKDQLKTSEEIDRLSLTANFAFELDMMYPGVLKKLNSTLFPGFVSRFFKDVVKTIIEQRNGKPTDWNDFMDLILALRQLGDIQATKRNSEDKEYSIELTDELIEAQAFVFYIAGYETSATTMTFMLYQLALNPDIQDKVIAEIDQGLKESKGEVTYEMLQNLTYFEKASNETLRMYSIVEPLQRNAKIDCKIPDTDIVIEKGTTVLFSPLGIHHDEKYYPNPSKFDPERFSPANISARHPCAHIPFGTGPRNCIGMRFAKIQSRVCMVKMFSKFRFELAKNTPRNLDIDPTRLLLGPKGGIPLKIVRR